MADSLVLTGVKDVKKHTGTEMLLTRPKRGGDTHSVKEWWKGGGVSTCYAECTIFAVTAGASTVKLVLDTNMSTNVRIDHDGSFGFEFFGPNEIRRGALYTEDMQLIEHYVFPAISGGKVMTVTPAGAAPKPGAGPAPTIGTVTVSGDATASDGDTKTYTVSIDGTAASLTYLWTVTGDGSVNGSATGASADVDLVTGSATVFCQVTAADAGVTDSPKSGNITVTTT